MNNVLKNGWNCLQLVVHWKNYIIPFNIVKRLTNLINLALALDLDENLEKYWMKRLYRFLK